MFFQRPKSALGAHQFFKSGDLICERQGASRRFHRVEVTAGDVRFTSQITKLICPVSALILCLVLITGVFQSDVAVAQEAANKPKIKEPQSLEKVAKPFLWRIENEKAPEKPSYLFGTIHVTDPRVLKLHPLAEKAFEESDTLFLEMKPTDVFKQIKPLILPDDIKLTDQIDEETLARLDKQLELINPILVGRHRPNYKVWVWPIILPTLKAQLKNKSQEVLDFHLATRASRAGKPIGGLEDAETQLNGMETLTLEEQIAFLKDALTGMEEAAEDELDPETELTELYLRGSMKELKQFLDEENESGEMSEELIEKLMDAMLYSRNQKMAETIVRAMEKHSDKSHFFAAGSAHFAGDKSVQAFLKKAGLKVTRVRSKQKPKNRKEKASESSQLETEPATAK